MLRAGETTASALLEAALDTASRTEAELHAFLTIDAEGAREAAAQADADLADGIDHGPLHGIPTALKDNMCTRGVETTAASQILAGYLPPYDATVVSKLRERWRGDHRQDQPRRVRHGLVDRELGLWHHVQPMGH